MHITKIFQLIDNASGSNEKLAILEKNKDNEDLKKVFLYTNDPFIRFYVKSERLKPGEIDLESFYEAKEYKFSEALTMLERVINRDITGNAAIDYISDIITGLSGEEGDLLKRTIDKNLRCGIKAKQANKIWPGLIREMPIMKCADAAKDAKAMEMMVFPAYAQLKIDAARCTAVKYEDRIELLSSNGKLFQKLESLTAELDSMMEVGDAIDGELWFAKLPRKQSNGKANKSLKGTIKPSEANDVQFIVWDKLESFDIFDKLVIETPYRQRLESLIQSIPENADHVELVEMRIVESFDELNEYLISVYARGEEGLILKHMDGPWEFSRSRYGIKFKESKEADFEITEINLGTGSNANRMGDVQFKTSDGVITSGVGIGFTDEDRQYFWDNRDQLIGKIITVRYNMRVDDSLFLTRYVELRFDKDVADTEDRV